MIPHDSSTGMYRVTFMESSRETQQWRVRREDLADNLGLAGFVLQF